MRYIKDIIKYFTFITTGIIILFIVLMLIQGDKELCLSTLIEIPCAGLATSVVTVFLYPFEEQRGIFSAYTAPLSCTLHHYDNNGQAIWLDKIEYWRNTAHDALGCGYLYIYIRRYIHHFKERSI